MPCSHINPWKYDTASDRPHRLPSRDLSPNKLGNADSRTKGLRSGSSISARIATAELKP